MIDSEEFDSLTDQERVLWDLYESITRFEWDGLPESELENFGVIDTDELL